LAFSGDVKRFQYALVEYARNIAGLGQADFEEMAPDSTTAVISSLMCSLAGVEQEVFIPPGSLAFKVYKRSKTTETFTCNYGLNEAYRQDILQGSLLVVGEDGDGNARIIELSSHSFFMATLFLPQLSSKPGHPHPVIMAFLEAAAAFRTATP
jgi:CTP synthase (UTP-ammonia lyase)